MSRGIMHIDDDKLHEECGVFGIYGHDDAAAMTALGLHALQHRGQESCGIVAWDGEVFNSHKALGLVGENFNKPNVMESLQGHAAIGHNRYSTTGETLLRNVQPVYGDMAFGGFALAHNGNLTNAVKLRRELVRQGALFHATNDTEVVLHLMARSQETQTTDRFIDALKQIKGGYAIVATTDDCVIGVRDPHGIRPLVLGKVGDAHVLASETCALDIIGAELVREVLPGEMIILNADGVHASRPLHSNQTRMCIFEFVYFARPDSMFGGRSVYGIRRNIGQELAKEAPAENAELVVPVPDSGVPSAIGYAAESGLPFELGIIRNHYVGRTFIEPTQQIRHLGVKLKHNVNRELIEGKSIVLVDDSIVRGTTSKKIVDMLRGAGVKEIHMRISSPPTKYSDFYGIDTPSSEELLANRMSVSEIADYIQVDSLSYVSIDGLYRAMGVPQGRDDENSAYTDSCFTGDYPVELVDRNEQQTSSPVTSLKERSA